VREREAVAGLNIRSDNVRMILGVAYATQSRHGLRTPERPRSDDMITAIFTTEATTLTIETSEDVNLVEMGCESTPIRFRPGLNEVFIAPGVFKVESAQPVRVASRSPYTVVLSTTNNKDGTFPDQTKLAKLDVDRSAIRKFFSDSKSMPAPG
jgi:hypothetical protein